MMHTLLVLMAAALLVAPAMGTELFAQNARPAAEARAAVAADSMDRVARAMLNNGEYRRAAASFSELQRRYPDSQVAPAALYWQAFALYRLGSSSALTDVLAEARMAVDRLAELYPHALNPDVRTLALRIDGMLAQLGDVSAAQAVTAAAVAPPAPPTPPRGAAPAPAPVMAPAPPSPRANAPGPSRRPADCPDDEDHEVRVAALNALLQVDAERAMPILQQVLQRRDPCSVELRRRAVFLVQQKRVPETDRILLDVARNDPDSDVRGQAVHWLASVNTEGAVTALEEILLRGTDDQLRDRALFALSRHPSERAPAILRRVVEDERASTELRQRAIFWVAERRGNSEYLRSLYGRVQDEKIKEHILFGLSRSADAEDGRWLMNIALRSDEPIELRKRALFWASQRRTLPSAELIALYERVTDREMKEQLIYLYSQRRTEETTTKLIDIVRRERDPELRKRAIFWLGQSKDPRAAEVLREVITP